jgi:hypothetical protein
MEVKFHTILTVALYGSKLSVSPSSFWLACQWASVHIRMWEAKKKFLLCRESNSTLLTAIPAHLVCKLRVIMERYFLKFITLNVTPY